ncbi:hypothetical protein F4801DRAFT_515371 [Xylaria longipes]|nr:hypothetical protein F4801DRAFT_515371 [Xylaria longipes]RYC56023.1 hypothetical protein CHU98_g10189 [Xylaria longipes]
MATPTLLRRFAGGGWRTVSETHSDSVSMYKGPTGPLCHRCPLCPATGSQLLRCAGCRAFRYCSREHQVAHRPQHKSACNKIKKARARLAREDHGIRDAIPDFMTPANAFETHVGHFWGLLSTREYMRARFGLVRPLILLATLDGVEEGLEHMRDMMILCRSDNMGFRTMAPAIMLRLDLDQECYDFIKWWATCDPDGRYDWGDVTLPYLDIREADVLEDPGFLLGKHPELNFLVALLLLKLKLLVDIRNLKITRKVLAQRLPFELQDQIERDVVRSPLSAKLQRETPESLSKAELKLINHARQLGAAILETNGDFMFVLFEPDEALTDTPESYSSGSWEEMVIAMQNSYATWWETEGVLELLKDARHCASRESERDVEGLMENKRARKGRMPWELLEDLSVNRIWGYLDDAVENATYLGPWYDRPSERRTMANREARERAVEEEAGLEDFSDDGAWSDDED